MIHVEILGIACLSIILVNFGKPADIIKAIKYGRNPYNWQRMKPLDCAFCMSWWIGVSYFIIQYGLVGVLYASISTIIVALLETKI
jgi:hypothetical protein